MQERGKTDLAKALASIRENAEFRRVAVQQARLFLVRCDEARLLAQVQRLQPAADLRQVVAEMGMAPKRAAYLLEKWMARGWYTCGVSIWCGWLEAVGRRALVVSWDRAAGRAVIVGACASDCA